MPDSVLVDALNGKGIAIDARHGVELNGNTRIVKADVVASNGVIHVIDKVLMPPGNLVEILEADGRFGTLVTAVKLAGLAPVLAEEGDTFTIFAPTDEAFEKGSQRNVGRTLEGCACSFQLASVSRCGWVCSLPSP